VNFNMERVILNNGVRMPMLGYSDHVGALHSLNEDAVGHGTLGIAQADGSIRSNDLRLGVRIRMPLLL
jgi:hypothetical protein